MTQHQTMTGLQALDRDLVQGVEPQGTSPGEMTHVSGVHVAGQQWGWEGVEWGGARNHCHCITDCVIQHDILLCWLACTLAPLPSPPLPSPPLPSSPQWGVVAAVLKFMLMAGPAL